ncbi:hypothetical protein [Microbulbifer agarilyticus]
MGFWSSVKKAAKKAAKALKETTEKVTEVVENVVETVGEYVADAVEEVGDYVEDKLDDVGDWVDDKIGWGGGIFRRAGDVLAAGSRVISSVVKGATGLVAGVFAGVVGILGAVVTVFLDPPTAWEIFKHGAVKFAESLVGSSLHPLAAFADMVQIGLGLYKPRKLNGKELDLLKRIYETGLKFGRVRIVTGKAGLFSLNEQAFVSGNIIYMKDVDKDPTRDYMTVLVHESVHVWQYQHWGSSYMGSALNERHFGTDYEWYLNYQTGLNWEYWPAESQAKFIGYMYAMGSLTTTRDTGGGIFFTPSDTDPALRTLLYRHDSVTHSVVDQANYTLHFVRNWVKEAVVDKSKDLLLQQ